MVIEVLYKSFRYEKFDSSAQTNSEPFRAKGTNILTDWNLYLGALEENGIILAEHWYDGNPQHAGGQVTLEGTKVPAATRQVGSAMLLVSPDELDDVVWLKKDGEKLLWREGDELINGERFFAMEQLCYSDATVQSINRRAIAVFDYLKHAHPTRSDDEIARIMGYTESAIERIRDAEISQDEGFVDDDGGRSKRGRQHRSYRRIRLRLEIERNEKRSSNEPPTKLQKTTQTRKEKRTHEDSRTNQEI